MSARATILLILSLAGGAGFLTSYAALNLGLTEMWARYALAGLAAYVTFLILMRALLSMRRDRWDFRDPGLDVGGIGGRGSGDGGDSIQIGGGGRSGGAGASGSWGSPRGSSALDGAGGSWDLDDGWPIALIVALAFGGVIAIFYVVYIAPVLLAELAVDAAMVSAAYGHLRKRDLPTRGGLVRRTWLPGMAVVLTLAIAGWVMQLAAPGARSIGGVVAALRN